MQENTLALIRQYYDYFNRDDITGFLSLLDENVVHLINQGDEEHGKQAFTAFMQRMAHSYQERISDLEIMVNQDGTRAAAEFIVNGKYLKTDHGLPEAQGQTYRLPCGAFFNIHHGKITRVANYYNLQDWLKQVTKA